MPTLEQALRRPQGIARREHHMQHTPLTMPDPTNPAGPNPFLRCPMPLAMNAPPTDSLRQFYRDGIPQFRTINPSLKSIWQV